MRVCPKKYFGFDKVALNLVKYAGWSLLENCMHELAGPRGQDAVKLDQGVQNQH